MAAEHTPFLTGAMSWIYDGEVPDKCGACGWDWATPPERALASIAAAPAKYAALLDGRNGMAPADDGGWNATAYLWHLTDLARGWSERWVQIAALPGSFLAGWDPDDLAGARNYTKLHTVSAIWALDDATATFVEQCYIVGLEATFDQGEWGVGTVADAIVWLGHEFTHHRLDVDERAIEAPGASSGSN